MTTPSGRSGASGPGVMSQKSLMATIFRWAPAERPDEQGGTVMVRAARRSNLLSRGSEVYRVGGSDVFIAGLGEPPSPWAC